MTRKLFGTVSGPDLPALAEAVMKTLPFAKQTPERMLRKLVEVPVGRDWKDQLLARDVEDLSARWGDRMLGRSGDVVKLDLPDTVRVDGKAVLDFLAPLPFELAVLRSLQDYWSENDYYAPAIGSDHDLLGWGIAFKGAGHDHSIVSRRWLEHGPFRTLHGANDTTLAQFHDLEADGPTSLQQATPAHEWIVAGFLRPKHRFENEIKGVYTKEDGLLRILINDREISDEELLDACASRRDGGRDPAKPIKNIAYIFVDEKAARANLERLWLRELECRVADGKGERRLDTDYKPRIKKPAWV